MKTVARKSTKPVVKTELFHKVPIRTTVTVNGKQGIKFAAKKVMTTKGEVLTIADSTTVIVG